MNTPTKPPTRKGAAADLRLTIGTLLVTCRHLSDAIMGAQTLGLADAELRGHFAVLRRRADELSAIADRIDTPSAPKFELIPGGIASSGVCPECGRIGDHQPRCPEVSR